MVALSKKLIGHAYPRVCEFVACLHAEESSIDATETHIDSCLSIDCDLNFFPGASLAVVDEHSKLKAEFILRPILLIRRSTIAFYFNVF